MREERLLYLDGGMRPKERLIVLDPGGPGRIGVYENPCRELGAGLGILGCLRIQRADEDEILSLLAARIYLLDSMVPRRDRVPRFGPTVGDL